MPDAAVDPPPLAGIRVVDLASERAELCGRILADLGAEVIKVEPPGGAAARRLPPFERGREHDPDGSLYWAAVALGKASVVLDIASGAGRDALRRLLASADVFVESFEPGSLDAIGLGFDAISALNPALIYVSVTPYGQTGPDALSPATELTIEAAGGLVGLQGDGDRPPLPVGFPQAAFHAGAQAAVDAIVALNERAVSGLGQQLDVSMQAAMVWTLMNSTGFPTVTGANQPGFCEQRAGPRPELVPGVVVPTRYELADGTAFSSIRTGRVGQRTFHLLVQWAAEEGWPVPAHIRDRDWVSWREDFLGGSLTAAEANEAFAICAGFLATRTKREVMDRAVRDALVLAPTYTIPELLSCPQLAAREFWHDVGGRTHPGPIARLSRTPLRPGHPAPRLGVSRHRIEEARRPSAPPPSGEPRGGAFDGLKVADFSWVGVGPLTAKVLADHGATVVHVESPRHPDVLRSIQPFKDNVPGLDRSQFFANFNTSKLGMSLDFSSEAGRDLARRLIAWADVVVESFTPGTMARIGLGWETVSKTHPDLLMLSTCLRGQTGPERLYGGFGTQGAALAGVAGLTGWPDRSPCGTFGAYTDFIAPRYAAATLAAAVFERRRTGKGQWIDLSQVEASIHFIEPVILDYTVNGHARGPAGLESERACPHGTYRCAGEERYVAIACETPAQWQALCAAAPLAAFGDPALDHLAARLLHDAAIDAVIAAWCAPQEPFALAGRLKRCGVPAAVVQWPKDLHERDAQLAHRGFFVPLDHTEMGNVLYDGFVTRFSATPGRLRKAAPVLGEDTMTVLTGVLGLTPGEIADYAAAGVLG